MLRKPKNLIRFTGRHVVNIPIESASDYSSNE